MELCRVKTKEIYQKEDYEVLMDPIEFRVFD